MQAACSVGVEQEEEEEEDEGCGNLVYILTHTAQDTC